MRTRSARFELLQCEQSKDNARLAEVDRSGRCKERRRSDLAIVRTPKDDLKWPRRSANRVVQTTRVWRKGNVGGWDESVKA